ncbi:MAG: bifunctional 3-(3-hydroxy-phenyl)propionate/3-hydroxycinnamic acid hydroxylase [Streptosporangiales bacterium]|nr:bifunctional 3-(3-hydroxy-phenyl)propionate/3-hydroxycinnamic acid hydroxylase [Streptosporangiales bacterium]
MSTADCEVAVVGLGPVGGILANLLGLAGLSVTVLDRELAALELPRGVGIDAEIMRVVQTLGLAGKLEPLLKVFRGAQYLDAGGEVVSTRPGVTGPGPQGWPARYNVHQPEFEGVLREGLAARENVTVLAGHEVDEVRNEDPFGGMVAGRDLASGERVTVRARYVVGCDGARSVVRRAAGLELDDFGLNQPWVVTDFAVSDQAGLPPVNTHYADPESPAIYIHVVRNLRRFEFRGKPGEDLTDATTPEAAWKRVARWLTPDQGELLRAAVYTHRSLVARHWRAGPLIVAGDAAHQTPPFLGQGLCTGVRDAMSLAWRLKTVVGDGAPDALLDSYETERSGHARFYIQTSTSLGNALSSPDKATLEALNARVGREGSGAAPRLGPGLFEPGPGVGGTLAPQPRLDGGRLLDDVTGYRFALVTRARLPEETAGLAAAAGLRVAEATGDAAGWLSDLGADSVIIRPDRYYYGAYTDLAELDHAVRAIAAAVTSVTGGTQ